LNGMDEFIKCLIHFFLLVLVEEIVDAFSSDSFHVVTKVFRPPQVVGHVPALVHHKDKGQEQAGFGRQACSDVARAGSPRLDRVAELERRHDRKSHEHRPRERPVGYAQRLDASEVTEEEREKKRPDETAPGGEDLPSYGEQDARGEPSYVAHHLRLLLRGELPEILLLATLQRELDVVVVGGAHEAGASLEPSPQGLHVLVLLPEHGGVLRE